MTEETSSGLYLPEFCIITSKVRDDKNLQAEAKIFCGELAVLSSKHGYCWGHDEEFAELKGVSESTVKRWFKSLEDGGHIHRETVSVRYQNEDNEKKSWLWKKKRKIWVGPAVSKKSSDRPKNEPFNDRPKNEPFVDRPKSEPIIKGKEKEKTTTNEKPPKKTPPKPEPRSSSFDFCLKKDEVLKRLPLSTQTKFNLQTFSLEILKAAAAKPISNKILDVDGHFFALCYRLKDGTQSMETAPRSREDAINNVKSTVQDMYEEVDFPPGHEIKFVEGGYHLFKDGCPAATVGYGELDCIGDTEKIIKYLKEQNVKG